MGIKLQRVLLNIIELIVDRRYLEPWHENGI